MNRIAHLVAAGLLLSLPAAAQTTQQGPDQLYYEGDLKLESGEAIKDFSISYVTYGTLNAKKSNAILMVTALSGNHHRLDFLIGPEKALDPEKYFIICTDAIANGLTTSPSNSSFNRACNFRNSLSATWWNRNIGCCEKNSASIMSWRSLAPRWAECRLCNGE
jgi:homoserine O-acetyltransferase/O-succinyltransferase